MRWLDGYQLHVCWLSTELIVAGQAQYADWKYEEPASVGLCKVEKYTFMPKADYYTLYLNM